MISISEAKQRLGEFADRAIQGEQILIVRKSKLLVLKELEIPDPVPIRPAGYFADCYDDEYVLESNELGSQSTCKLVRRDSGRYSSSHSTRLFRIKVLTAIFASQTLPYIAG